MYFLAIHKPGHKLSHYQPLFVRNHQLVCQSLGWSIGLLVSELVGQLVVQLVGW